MSSSAWTLNRLDGGIAELVFDLPGEKVNKFTPAVMEELEQNIDQLEKNPCSVLLIKSGKSGIFIAGADISDIQTITSKELADQKLKKGQDVFNKIEQLPFATVAVIEGACMGGGTELALACDERWMSDSPKAKCALPEVKLGILPGWGGTQRLPKLIGLQKALDMILTGKAIDAKKAKRMGFAQVVFASTFASASIQKESQRLLGGQKIQSKKKPFKDVLLENNPLGQKLIFSLAQKNVDKKGGKHYPALNEILTLMQDSSSLSMSEGLAKERAHFSNLIVGDVAPNLIQVYFNNEAIKKCPLDETPTSFTNANVGVLGAGIMGGGISWLFAHKGHAVRMKDLQHEALAKGYESAHQIYKSLKKIRRAKDGDISNGLTRITGSLDYSGFKRQKLVVEAVVENMEVKKKVLAELENEVQDDCLICSNTSALSITEMGSVLKRPENFVGMHFFNPVNRMPLVEVIAGEKSSPEAVASIFHLSQKLGKTPVIVKDVAGFLVNRILLAYMNEAARCLEDGAQIEQVDRLLTQYGMPMGPFHLSDEVGIDVGYHVAKTLEEAYGERMKVSKSLEYIFKDKKLLGKKKGLGFYEWDGKNKKLNTDLQSEYQNMANGKSLADQDILDRCKFTMLRESILCLQEEVVATPGTLDMAMLMGTGFPPFKGGPILEIDHMGSEVFCDHLKRLSDQHGARFAPPSHLEEKARQKQGFYPSSN